MADLDLVLRDGLQVAVPRTQDRGIIGEIKSYAGWQLPEGFLWCDGSEVSSAAEDYASLAGAIGGGYGTARTVATVGTTNGSADVYFAWVGPSAPPYRVITVGDVFFLANPADFSIVTADFPGLSATLIPVYIVQVDAGSSPDFQISLTPGGTALVATATNGSPTTFEVEKWFPTFTLPDLRGRVLAGRDNMGGTAASKLTSAANGFGTSADVLGAVGGAQNHLLLSTESGLPAHFHYVGGGQNTVQRTNTGIITAGAGGANSSPNAAANAASAHVNVQPTAIVNHIIRAS